MEQKNEQTVHEAMARYAGDVIESIQDKEFSTRDFIEAFADKHEIVYVELLYGAYKDDSSRVFHRVHALIGSYLADHQEQFGIEKNGRISTRNPFGRTNEVQNWRKIG